MFYHKLGSNKPSELLINGYRENNYTLGLLTYLSFLMLTDQGYANRSRICSFLFLHLQLRANKL